MGPDMAVSDSSYPEGTKFTPHTFSFLAPARLKIRRPDGSIETVGYGIGEQIQVMQPSLRYPVGGAKALTEVPLADGSVIIEYPADIRTRPVYRD